MWEEHIEYRRALGGRQRIYVGRKIALVGSTPRGLGEQSAPDVSVANIEPSKGRNATRFPVGDLELLKGFFRLFGCEHLRAGQHDQSQERDRGVRSDRDLGVEVSVFRPIDHDEVQAVLKAEKRSRDCPIQIDRCPSRASRRVDPSGQGRY
jgi:hypothetical protein